MNENEIVVQCYSCLKPVESEGVGVQCPEEGCTWRQTLCQRCGELLSDPDNPIAQAVKQHGYVHRPFTVIRLHLGEQKKGEAIGQAGNEEEIKAILKPDAAEHPQHDYAVLNQKTGQYVLVAIGQK